MLRADGVLFRDRALVPIREKVRSGERLDHADGLTLLETLDLPALGRPGRRCGEAEERRPGAVRREPADQPDESLRPVLRLLRFRGEAGRRACLRAIARRGARPGHRRALGSPHRRRAAPEVALRAVSGDRPGDPRSLPAGADQGVDRGRDRLVRPSREDLDRGHPDPAQGSRTPEPSGWRRRSLLRPRPQGDLPDEDRPPAVVRGASRRAPPRHHVERDAALRGISKRSPNAWITCCSSGKPRTTAHPRTPVSLPSSRSRCSPGTPDSPSARRPSSRTCGPSPARGSCSTTSRTSRPTG